MKIQKKLSIAILHFVIALTLIACSKQQGVDESAPFRYVTDLRQVDAQGGIVRGAFLCGEELVYEVYYSGEGIKAARCEYYTVSLAQRDAGARQIHFRFPGGWTHIDDIVKDDDGNYYILGSNAEFSTSGDVGFPGYFVGIYDAQGNVLHAWGISEWLQETGAEINVQSLVLDNRKNIYVVGQEALLVMDSNGAYLGCFMETAIYFATCMADGRVGYCCAADRNRQQMRTIDPKTIQSETIIFDSPIGIGGIVGDDSQLWVFDKYGIYRHREGEQVPEQILGWLDADVNTSDLWDMIRLSDGCLLLLLYDERVNGMAFEPEEGQPPELVYLEKVEKEDNNQEFITVGVMSLTDNMREATIRYNQENPQYRIRLKEYMGLNGYSTHEEAVAALDRDIVAGRDMDIIAVRYTDLEKYASKNILEDMLPLLDNSSRLRREDVLAPVADTYTLDGKLVALPTWFRLEVISGRKSMVGDRDRWSLSEMMAFFDQYQDDRTLQSICPEDMLDVCLKFNLSCFVDEENYTCAFEQDEFYQILEFAGCFTGKNSPYGWNNIFREDGRVLRLSWCVKSDYISEMPQWFEGEEVSYVGYPASDGQPGILLETSSGNAYAILSDSPHREQAWDYLEFLILEEGERADYFSILKDKLEQNLATATQEPYERDKEGMIVRDREGKPVRRILNINTFSGSDLTIENYVPLPEEVKQLQALIALARPAPMYQEAVMSIIQEEAASYFDGDKDAREATRIIQSRVQIYLNERR